MPDFQTAAAALLARLNDLTIEELGQANATALQVHEQTTQRLDELTAPKEQ